MSLLKEPDFGTPARTSDTTVTVEVEKFSVGDFDDSLSNNIIVCPAKKSDPQLVTV